MARLDLDRCNPPESRANVEIASGPLGERAHVPLPMASTTEFEGRRIKAAAAQAGVSLTGLAHKLGLSRATLYAYVSGAVHPSRERIKEIAGLTGTTLDFFRHHEHRLVSEGANAAVTLADAWLAPPDPRRAGELLERHINSVPVESRGDYCLALAEKLMECGEHQDAILWATKAKGIFVDAQETTKVGLADYCLGWGYLRVGPLRRSQACMEDAAEFMDPAKKWRAQLVLARIAGRRGAYAEGVTIIRQAEIAGSQQARASATVIEASLQLSLGDWQKAFELAEEGLGLADAASDREAMASAFWPLCMAAVRLQRPDAAQKLAQGLGFFQGLGSPRRRAMFLTIQSAASLANGDTTCAKNYATEALETAIKQRNRWAEVSAYLRLCEVAIQLSDAEDAISKARRALAYADSYEYAHGRDYAEATLAYLSAYTGDFDAYDRHVAALEGRDTWQPCSHIVEVVAAARAIRSGSNRVAYEPGPARLWLMPAS